MIPKRSQTYVTMITDHEAQQVECASSTGQQPVVFVRGLLLLPLASRSQTVILERRPVPEHQILAIQGCLSRLRGWIEMVAYEWLWPCRYYAVYARKSSTYGIALAEPTVSSAPDAWAGRE